MTPLHFTMGPDPEDPQAEHSVLQGTDLTASVWPSDDGWCWGVIQGSGLVDNGIAETRHRARIESRRYAVGVMAHVLDWGRWA